MCEFPRESVKNRSASVCRWRVHILKCVRCLINAWNSRSIVRDLCCQTNHNRWCENVVSFQRTVFQTPFTVCILCYGRPFIVLWSCANAATANRPNIRVIRSRTRHNLTPFAFWCVCIDISICVPCLCECVHVSRLSVARYYEWSVDESVREYSVYEFVCWVFCMCASERLFAWVWECCFLWMIQRILREHEFIWMGHTQTQNPWKMSSRAHCLEVRLFILRRCDKDIFPV